MDKKKILSIEDDKTHAELIREALEREGYEVRMAMSSKLIPEAGQMIEDTSVALANALTPGEVPERPKANLNPDPKKALWSYSAKSDKA